MKIVFKNSWATNDNFKTADEADINSKMADPSTACQIAAIGRMKPSSAPPGSAIYGCGFNSCGCNLRLSEVRSGAFGVDLAPVWNPLGPKPAPNGPRTTSNCSHMSCSHVHRSPTGRGAVSDDRGHRHRLGLGQKLQCPVPQLPGRCAVALTNSIPWVPGYTGSPGIRYVLGIEARLRPWRFSSWRIYRRGFREL